MPLFSHSQLSMYQQCPLKYRLRYRDKIKRDTEGVEAFLGTVIHQVLKKCYDNARRSKVNTLDELLTCYTELWQQQWHDAIIITSQELTQDHYLALGRRLIKTYYQRYAPFDTDITIATEMRLTFSLDDNNKYQMTGFIDRLSRTSDDFYQIHDYKTSAYLPGQEEADHDQQLGLYHLGVKRKWPDIKNIRLIWHYLAFDRELVSVRSDEAIAQMTGNAIELITKIQSTIDFPPQESYLCQWCQYPDLCPMRKHFYQVAALPENEYLNEPGVTLVNRYAELREQASSIEKEMNKVKEAIVDYARRQQVQVIKGSQDKARIAFDRKLKFPGKNATERKQLDNIIKEKGKWAEVSQLDTTLLVRAIENKLWDKDLIDRVLQHGHIEETSAVYFSGLKEE